MKESKAQWQDLSNVLYLPVIACALDVTSIAERPSSLAVSIITARLSVLVDCDCYYRGSDRACCLCEYASRKRVRSVRSQILSDHSDSMRARCLCDHRDIKRTCRLYYRRCTTRACYLCENRPSCSPAQSSPVACSAPAAAAASDAIVVALVARRLRCLPFGSGCLRSLLTSVW